MQTVTLPAWALKELLHYAKPALEAECAALGQAGHSASEHRQNEMEAVRLAEERLIDADTSAPALEG